MCSLDPAWFGLLSSFSFELRPTGVSAPAQMVGPTGQIKLGLGAREAYRGSLDRRKVKHIRWTLERVRAVLSDFGSEATVADIEDLLPSVVAAVFKGAPPVEKFQYLFPHAFFFPGRCESRPPLRFPEGGSAARCPGMFDVKF